MSKAYESIMEGLKEAVNDAKGENKLPRKHVELFNIISSQEALKKDLPVDKKQ